MKFKTYARIENGAEVEQVVVPEGVGVAAGDWRPVVIEGADYDAVRYREVRRDTRIDPERVVRVVVTEPIPPPTREEYGQAVEAHVDAVARSRGYSGAVSMISYESSTVPHFVAEAAALRVWRDAVWLRVGEVEAAVFAGAMPPPTVAELIAALPQQPF